MKYYQIIELILGMAGYLDRKLLGSAHLYNEPTCKEVYNTKIPYDPEGKKNNYAGYSFVCL
jgi:hypothetical protein